MLRAVPHHDCPGGGRSRGPGRDLARAIGNQKAAPKARARSAPAPPLLPRTDRGTGPRPARWSACAWGSRTRTISTGAKPGIQTRSHAELPRCASAPVSAASASTIMPTPGLCRRHTHDLRHSCATQFQPPAVFCGRVTQIYCSVSARRYSTGSPAISQNTHSRSHVQHLQTSRVLPRRAMLSRSISNCRRDITR